MNSPIELYKAFIDDLLTWPRTSVTARHVREWRDGTPKPYELSPEFNDLMAKFSSEQRHLLSNMLQESHESGMFAVLAYLTDEINLPLPVCTVAPRSSTMSAQQRKEVTMFTRLAMTQHMLDQAFATLAAHLTALTLDEALFVPHGGFRSVLGTLKHAAAWSHVYRSYAFDAAPTAWHALDWPHGLRDTIISSQSYLDAVIDWLHHAHTRWQDDLAQRQDHDLDALRSVHWGATLPLYEIIVRITQHHIYHAGEINQLLAIRREEAWEEGEEVEENHISTLGHRVVPPWKRDQNVSSS